MSSGDKWWQEKPDSKERIQETLDKSEENRIRKKEINQVKSHEKSSNSLGENNEEFSNDFSISPENTRIGFLRIWWLSSGEAVAIGLGGVFLIITLFGGLMAITDSDSFEEVNGEIIAKFPGWEWIENEDCYDDGYCELYYELECYVHLDIQITKALNQNWSNFEENPEYLLDDYVFKSDGIIIDYFGDYLGSEQDCLDYAYNETFELGSTFKLFYNTENPTEIRVSDPLVGAVSVSVISGGCCLVFFLVLILNARYSNSPAINTDFVSKNGMNKSGDGHTHHHYGLASRFGFAGRSRGRARGSFRNISRSRKNSQRQGSDGGGRLGGGGRSSDDER